MTDHIILDADCTANLIASGKIALLKDLFGSVVMPSKVQEELMEAGHTRGWAGNPPDWVKVDSPKQIDPKVVEYNKRCEELEAKGAGKVRRIDAGEAAAISLAKEIAGREGHPTSVLSNEWLVRDFLNAEGANQKVFATSFWSVICQAAGRGLMDLDKERAQLEKFNTPNSTERDHINELDSPTKEIKHENKGYTQKEVLDMYQSSDWLKQQMQKFEQERAAQQELHDHSQEQER